MSGHHYSGKRSCSCAPPTPAPSANATANEMQILSGPCSWKCSRNLKWNSKLELDVDWAWKWKWCKMVEVQGAYESIAMTWPDCFKINVIISISWRVFAAVPTFNYAANRTAAGSDRIGVADYGVNGGQNQYHFVPSF